MADAEIELSLDEVLDELDELGRAKFDTAHAKATARKISKQLQDANTRIAELEKQKAPAAVAAIDG